MSTRNIINAAPMSISLNTADNSTRALDRQPETIAQHIPKVYLYTKKGTDLEQLVDVSSRDNIYGAESFDLRSNYATHQTLLAQKMTANTNPMMIKRLIPEDAGPRANLTLWLDLLETEVDLYERNESGGIVYDDTTNDPIVTGTAVGYKAKWVVTNAVNDTEAVAIGNRVIGAGDQSDGATQSQRIPIKEFVVADQGAYGNNLGIRLWSFGGSSRAIPPTLMTEERCYPFMMNIIKRENTRTSPEVIETINNERDVMFTYKPNTVNPDTDMNMYLGNMVANEYTDTSTKGYPPIYGAFGDVHIYDEHIRQVVEMIHTSESPYIDVNTDFSDEVTDAFLVNIIGGFNSNGSPYHTYQFVDDTGAVKLTEYTHLFCAGGGDGTMSYEDVPTDPADPDSPVILGFNSLVKRELERYNDIDDPLMEMAVNVESTFWDTGFPLEVKEAATNFISQRPDTYLMLSTFQHGMTGLTMSEEQSIGMALRTRLEMTPESDYFGTPVMRAVIFEGNALLRNSQWTHRVSTLFDLASKVAAYMGSGTGKWQSEAAFDDPDAGENRIVSDLYDISTPYMSAITRSRRWDIGLNWVQPDNREEYFYPAIRTAYSDDTSVLTSFVNMAAICYLNKITQAAWRRFTGSGKLTPEELQERVNTFVIDKVTGIFDERFVIVPETQFTAADKQRGYSWQLPVSFYANNMTTVQTTYIKAFRRSDLG